MKSFTGKIKFLNKGSDKEATEEDVTPEIEPSVEQPPLAPNHFFAMTNALAPVVISTQGVTCRIDYFEDVREYRLKVSTQGRVVSTEIIDPLDRRKKAVADFVFKGLIGVHLHPAGMVFALDEEKNLRGEARHNQEHAKIMSAEVSPAAIQLDRKRFATLDIRKSLKDQPILISPNKGKMHMQIMPIAGTVNEWGVFISTVKGIVRDESQPAVVLKSGKSVVLDRNFFTSLAVSNEGGIDARAWNKEIEDPVMLRLQVDSSGLLTMEELFTVNGVTVLFLEDAPLELGFLGVKSENEKLRLWQQYTKTLVSIRDDTFDELKDRGVDKALLRDCKGVLDEVARVLPMRNQDRVSLLALELATKEVLASFYGNTSGNEASMTVDPNMVRLLNAIVGELCGWVAADSSRAVAVTAVERAIGLATQPLEIKGLEEAMLMELPPIKGKYSDAESVSFNDVLVYAKRILETKKFVKNIKQIFKEISESGDKFEQERLARQMDNHMRETVHDILEKVLVRLAVKSYLRKVEKEKRLSAGFDTSRLTTTPLTDRELSSVLVRYDSYAQYIGLAFEHRIERPLAALIRDFQQGIHAERDQMISTKGFLGHLIALRTSGGKVASKNDTVPVVSSLQSIPDAIPDICVTQPVPGVPKAFVRVIHREGVLCEVPFELAARSLSIPEGVSNGLWFGFRDLAERIMAYHLTGESHQKKDPKQHEAVVNLFTRHFLTAVVNLFRALKRVPTSDELHDATEILAEARGVLETREGETPEDELLDLKNRPGYVVEEPFNVRYELRMVVVSLQHSDAVDADAFRFKQHMRSFALVGAGPGRSVLLPITVTVAKGVVNLHAQLRDDLFEKSIRLVEMEEEEESVTEVLSKSSPESPKAHGPVAPAEAKQQRKESIYKLVHALPFFDRFSEYEKSSLAEFDTYFRVYRQGQAILQEGSKEAAFFINIKGTVRTIQKGNDLMQLGPGQMFGEMAFLANIPQTISALAVGSVLVLRVDQELLTRMSPESREKLKDRIIAVQVVRLAEETSWMGRTRKEQANGKLELAPQPSHTDTEGEIEELDRNQAFAMIDGLQFFSNFSTYEKRRMTAFYASFRTYRSNGEIIREGDTDTAFFIVIHGTVSVIKGNMVVVELGEGEFFGDMAFLTSTPRSTSVRSKGQVLVLRMDQKLIERLGPEIREKIKDRFISKLTERLLETMNVAS